MKTLSKAHSLTLRAGLLLALLGAAHSVRACINDRDTLAQEVAALKANDSGLPNVVRVITGRFERNPPRYYQMRLERVSREIAAHPTRLALYDDAGAACDRLHRSQDALQWMEKKRPQLLAAAPNTKATREQWYRYYANAGTFHAHLWLRSGANRKDMKELRQGRDMIKRAIAIKPNAHFGREKYQLKFMEWVLNPPKSTGKEEYFHDFLKLSDMNEGTNTDLLKESDYRDTVTGLSGLIVLGDAWASLDIYYALMQALGAQGNASIGALAGQRCFELLDNGRGSLIPNAQITEPLLRSSIIGASYMANQDTIREHYFALRSDAIAYQEKRLRYMDAKFQKGWHPDTHPNFWKEWKEPPLPSLEPSKPRQAPTSPTGFFIVLAFCTVCATYLGVIIGRVDATKRLKKATHSNDGQAE